MLAGTVRLPRLGPRARGISLPVRPPGLAAKPKRPVRRARHGCIRATCRLSYPMVCTNGPSPPHSNQIDLDSIPTPPDPPTCRPALAHALARSTLASPDLVAEVDRAQARLATRFVLVEEDLTNNSPARNGCSGELLQNTPKSGERANYPRPAGFKAATAHGWMITEARINGQPAS